MAGTQNLEDREIRQHLVEFLRGKGAHVDLDAAVKDFPPPQYAKKPAGAPHNAWQLLEHMRISLHDLLDFCTDSDYVAPEWPAGYWPERDAPVDRQEWDQSVRALKEDLKDFEKLVKDPATNLYAKIPWGEGQTVLREALLAGDHTSYHLGQLVMLRKQLDAWNG